MFPDLGWLQGLAISLCATVSALVATGGYHLGKASLRRSHDKMMAHAEEAGIMRVGSRAYRLLRIDAPYAAALDKELKDKEARS